jgi:hypothetical protein
MKEKYHMDDIGTMILVIITAPIGFVVAYFIIKGREKVAKENLESLKIIIDDSFQISPQIKHSLTQFSASNVSELRNMNAQDLCNLLSCCSNALKVFEHRVKRISEGYVKYEDLTVGQAPISLTPITRGNREDFIKKKEKELAPEKAQLDEQAKLVIDIFDEDLRAEGSVLNIIPEKYRLSVILDMMCDYLSTGEVDSWEGCIKTFKEDAHRMQQMAYYQNFSESLGRIEKNTSRIAFYSAVTAFNTL